MTHKSTAMAVTGLILLLSTLGWRTAGAAGMTLYRCTIDGVVEFRQTACEAGEQTRQPVVNSSSGMTPSEPGLRLKKPSEKSDRVLSVKPEPVSDKQCWKKRQQLDRVERRLRAGYRASEYQRLHDRQREYEGFIRRFCR